MTTFLHISDSHISADPDYQPAYIPAGTPHPNRGLEKLLDAVGSLPFAIDFILHTGDVCADPGSEDVDCARELLRRFSQPLFLLPGNHDSAALLGERLHDGVNLRVLRDELVALQGVNLLSLDTCRDGDVHAPLLPEPQIETFAGNLRRSRGKPTIVALHHPLIETGVEWLDAAMRVQNGERVHQLLAEHARDIAGVFHGHIHQATSTIRDGIVYSGCPSTWSNLAGYPGLSVDEADPDERGGFSLVMLRRGAAFIRRCSLPGD